MFGSHTWYARKAGTGTGSGWRSSLARLAAGVVTSALLIMACSPTGARPPSPGPQASQGQQEKGYAHPEILAETGWLAEHLKDPDVRVVDMRSEDNYKAGHIPNAVALNGNQLKDPDNPLYVTEPDKFDALMGKLGIGNDTTVVAYDDQGGLWPARLWWVLDYYQHRKAKVLNGGWSKWVKESRPVETEAPTVPQAEFKAKADPERICRVDQLVKAIDDRNYVIVDARSPAEYNGIDVRAARGGHVPKAVNIDWRRNVTNDDVKVFKPAEELRRMYESEGVTKDKRIVTYCQTAVRAAHTFFTLNLIGYGQLQNYDGSWAEWGNRQDLPIAR